MLKDVHEALLSKYSIDDKITSTVSKNRGEGLVFRGRTKEKNTNENKHRGDHNPVNLSSAITVRKRDTLKSIV